MTDENHCELNGVNVGAEKYAHNFNSPQALNASMSTPGRRAHVALLSSTSVVSQ